MTPTIFVLVRLIAIGLVIWAIGKHSNNYYILLRWLIFAIGLWGAYRAFNESTREWTFVVIHLALALLYNPLYPFTFEKSAWTIFNVITASVLLMSISILDSEPLENFMGTSVGNVIRYAIGIIWGVGLILFGAFLIYIAMDPIMKKWWIWQNPGQTKAQITKVILTVDAVEDDRGRVGFIEDYGVKYSYVVEGQTFYGSASLTDNPLNQELYEEEETIPIEATFLDIEYQTTNPANSRAFAEGSKFRDSIPEFLFIALGVWPIVAGVNTLRNRFSQPTYQSKKTQP